MMVKTIIANWKMNLPHGDVLGVDRYCQKFDAAQKAKMIIAPPFPFISMLQTRGFQVAGQDVSANSNGAFTGEVSAEMLAQVGAGYCIIGHSERRQYHHEGHGILTKKIIELLNHQVIPIFCVGEQKDDHLAKKTYDVLSAQLTALNGFKGRKIFIAYEPVWAIGTGENATTDTIKKIHHFLKTRLGKRVNILYGGSVNQTNAKDILSLKDVDGLLVGAASLKAEDMIKILSCLH
ncbi:MAG: triose-phosphate isomerase [Alphaproteobacteria bacterium]